MDKSAIPKRTGLPKLINQNTLNSNTPASIPGPSFVTSRFHNNPLRRRSNSVADLRPVPAKKFKRLETIPSVVRAPPTAAAPSVAARRPAPPQPQPVQNSAKAKVSAKQQVAKWDFKARYTQHMQICKHEEYVDKYTNLRVEFDCLKERHDKMAKEYMECKALNEELTTTVTQLLSKEKERKENERYMSELIEKLQTELLDKDSQRLQLHETVQNLKGNIRVFCRIRPPINAEEDKKEKCILEFDENSISIQSRSKKCPTQSFKLDKIFPPSSTQMDVFEELSQLVQSALDGYNVCIFAYGQTGSGKTYTMQGSLDDPEESGMIPRAINLLFESIEKYKLSRWIHKVTASFLEIYNENIYDLIQMSNQNLGIRYNKGKGTTVDDLIQVEVENVNKLQELLKITQGNRKVASTNYNARSSRSHAMTKLYLEGFHKVTKTTTRSSIVLVDLAGSESAKTSVGDERLTETKNINTSLMTLGQVMNALHQKCKHVPYRNSKLTYLLQSSLGGNSKTLMIVNVAPFEQNYQENLNSLRFAGTVKEVKNCIKKNKLLM